MLKSIFIRTKLSLGSLLFAGLAFAVGSLIFFGWLANQMSEGDTRGFDETVRLFVNQSAAPEITVLMQIASILGSTLFLTTLGLVIFIGFWLSGWQRAAILFAATMLGSSLLLFTLKNVFQRARPQPFFETLLPASYSFPSGHSLLSFCFYLALAAIITRRIERRLYQTIVWTFAVLLIALIGLSRIYLGVHYPSDVLAGYTAAFVWIVAVAVTDRFWRHRKSNGRERE